MAKDVKTSPLLEGLVDVSERERDEQRGAL